MIKFDEELDKFKPELAIDHIEEAIEEEDTKDIVDIIQKLMKTTHE